MVYFIGAGPGAADLITVRGAELLKKADVIIYAVLWSIRHFWITRKKNVKFITVRR